MKEKPVGIFPFSTFLQMGEDATNTPASSSLLLPTLRESRRGALPTFGNTAHARLTPAEGRSPLSVGSASLPSRVLLSFGNPPPSAPLVSLPVTTTILPQEVNSRNIEKEVTGIASPPFSLPPQYKPIASTSNSSTLLPTSTANTLSNVFFGLIGGKEQACEEKERSFAVNEGTGIVSPPLPKTQACEKNEATRLAANEVISFMDEEKEDTTCFREEMRLAMVVMEKNHRTRGISHEIVKKVMMDLESRVRKRKSANTRMKLLAMDNEEMCDNKFPIEEDDVADLCELLMRENSGIGRKFVRSLAEENDVWSLLELMMKESLKPVKITAWAENLKDFNWYYPDTEIRAVCEKLPQGIVQVKGDYFVMGEVLAEYNRLFKKVYTIGLQTLIAAHDGVYEKVSEVKDA